MEISQLFMWIVSIVCTVLGWFARELYLASQALRKDLSALETKIGTDYVRYDRLQDALKPLLEAIKEVKEVVAHKEDKK